MLDIAVRGARLVDGAITDIGIRGERIAQIGGEFEASMEIDAAGKLLLPGGVDAHVHLSSPPGGREGPLWVDDFTSGSAAALAAGITPVGKMTFAAPSETPRQALEREAALVKHQAIADVFLHPVLGTPDAAYLAEIPRLRQDGCTSIKIFLSSRAFDAHLGDYLEAERIAGANGTISMLHCEDHALMAYATRRWWYAATPR